MSENFIDGEVARWAAPSNIKALTTFRSGGVSGDVFDSLNLATHVGDDPAAVIENRIRLGVQLNLPSEPIWLRQVHGSQVVKAEPKSRNSMADGSYTTDRGVVCAILTADCIPLFLTDRIGSIVCLLHVGWRGLLAGVIERGLAAVKVEPKELLAWIGPGIGRDAFLVGDDVWEQLTKQRAIHHHSFERFNDRWLADLGQMVEQRLGLAGVKEMERSKHCTSTNPLAWFSHRRDGSCGRMASLIWIS